MLGLGVLLLALASALAVVGGSLATLPAAHSHAQAALVTVLLWYAAVHLAISLLMATFLGLRWRAGFVSARRRLEPRVVALFVHYSLGASLLCASLAYSLGR